MTTNTRSKLIMVLISLVSVLAIGCGSSNEEYVFTGTVPTANTGNVRFLLDRVAAQAADIPAESRSIYIEFFDAAGVSVGAPSFPTTAQLTGTGAQDFEVLVTGVPASAVAYEVTVYDGATPATSIPLVTFVGDINISVGNTVTADLDEALEDLTGINTVLVTPDPINLTNTTTTAQVSVTGTFDNGDVRNLTSFTNSSANTFVTFSFTGTAANVSAAGLVTAIANGNSTITAVVSSYGTSANDSATAVVTGFPVAP